jgi:23S rRNA pseudouridine2605 synthase
MSKPKASRDRQSPRVSRISRRPAPKSRDAGQNRRQQAQAGDQAEALDSSSGPQKIHKVLAQAGLGSRREMEELIRAGRVKVNGSLAQVGMRVQPGDVIRVGRRQVTVRDSAKLPRRRARSSVTTIRRGAPACSTGCRRCAAANGLPSAGWITTPAGC